MYSLLMTLGSLCLLATMILLAVIVVRLVKRKPIKKAMWILAACFMAVPVFVGIASSTAEGKLVNERAEQAKLMAQVAAVDLGAPVTPTLVEQPPAAPLVQDSMAQAVDAMPVPPPVLQSTESIVAKSLAAKLNAAHMAMDKSRWEEAGRLLLASQALANTASEAERQSSHMMALGERYVVARKRFEQFNATLFEALFQSIMVDEFKEPKGIAASAEAEWEIEEARRRTRATAKQFHVSSSYAERIYQEGPLLQRMAKHAELQQHEDQERLMLAGARCGKELTTNWSGEPLAVRTHLKETLHDAESATDLSCNGAWLTDAHCWVTNCTYRAKNLMGAYVLTGQKFYVANNQVTEAQDL
jgi:hypothetical protein